MFIVIPRATTKNNIQREMVRNTIDKLKWNTKRCSNQPKEARKGNKGNREQIINGMANVYIPHYEGKDNC